MTRTKASPAALFRSARGAFDLPSVMVGVVVVGILTAGVFAAVFGAVPWAQDRAAMQDLSSLTIAEGAAKSVDGQYAGPALMKEFGYLGDDAGLDYAIADDASCYVGVTKAATGRTFYTVTGSSPDELTPETDPDCLGTADFTQINVGSSNGCGVSAGAAYCWGYAGHGKLGRATTSEEYVEQPEKIGGLLEDKTIQEVRVGYYHVCALTTEGQVYCWGMNMQGELGNGTTTGSLEPVLVQGDMTGKKVTSIAATTYSTCAVAEENLYCWGHRGGSMGDTENTYQTSSPMLIDGGELAGVAVKSVAVSQFAGCVLSTEGKAVCWGNSDIGNSKKMPTAVNMRDAPGGTFTDLSIERDLACGTVSGAAVCWGSRALGGMYSGASAPQPVEGSAIAGKTITKTVSNGESACARDDQSNWYCWGELDGETSQYPVLRPLGIDGASADSLAGTSYGSLCMLAAGKIHCSERHSADPAAFKTLPDPVDMKTWVDIVLEGGKLPQP